ncbi:MAG: hypothetical protein JWP07_1278 [Pseudonocardiales bacterium]|jgi:hypothetical protein|nr:hypothetical protein [Pseudonocardiales bacterium]
MKLSFLVGGAIGYVLGARAGHERYEHIVAVARKVAGSQTIQSTAGVLRAQVDQARGQARETVAAKLRGTPVSHGTHTTNGHQH